MRNLRQLLIKYFPSLGQKDQISWTRETPWRQGSILPSACAVELGLIEKGETSRSVVVAVSHDCDLANDLENEPLVEIIVASQIEKCDPNRTHGKNVRTLHLDINVPEGRRPFELIANRKKSIAKRELAQFNPDQTYSLGEKDLITLQSWLAARYKRATIPDDLQSLIKSIFEEVGKKNENPHAIRGIWIDFDPADEHLEPGERYELWVYVVYDTSDGDSKEVAQQAAKEIEEKSQKKYYKDGKWNGVELRECKARSDTEFTLYDSYRFRRFRLEYLSLRVDATPETDNE